MRSRISASAFKVVSGEPMLFSEIAFDTNVSEVGITKLVTVTGLEGALAFSAAALLSLQ